MGWPLTTQSQFPLLNSPPAWPPREAFGYSEVAPTPVPEDVVREEVQKAPDGGRGRGEGLGLGCTGRIPRK